MESAERGDFDRLRRQQQEDERQDGDEPQYRPRRILILGDGNFSFSLALARALLPSRPATQQQSRPQKTFEIVATSFDGRLDLLSKYVESPGIIAALNALGVTVLHNVDATALDSRVVQVSSVDGHSVKHQFEHVIFNHPHTGTEDMRRHRSFLGHFFHAVANSLTNTAAAVRGPPVTVDASGVSNGVGSGRRYGESDSSGVGGGGTAAEVSGTADEHGRAGSILAPGGAVHVTLALDQPERWGLEEQAARHGFSLAHRRRFPAEKIDGYMTKRHQTGRSFQRKVQSSETLSFAWAADPRVALGERASSGTSSARTLPPWLWPEVAMCGNAAGAVRASSVSGEPYLKAQADGDAVDARRSTADEERGRDGCRSNRKGGGCVDRTGTAAAAVVVLPEVCELCGKRYKTAQALRTHTRQFHELGQEGGVPLAPWKELPCPYPDCGRVLTSDRALEQHVSAKHRGGNVDIKPDWFVGSIYHLEPPPSVPVPGNSDAIGARGREERGATAKEASFDQGGETAETDAEKPYPSKPASEPALWTSNNGVMSSWQKCEECGYWFSCPEDAQQHLDNLRPPIEGAATRYECDKCVRDFGSRRALLQHANFCGGR